jgi:hypothetical protein
MLEPQRGEINGAAHDPSIPFRRVSAFMSYYAAAGLTNALGGFVTRGDAPGCIMPPLRG